MRTASNRWKGAGRARPRSEPARRRFHTPRALHSSGGCARGFLTAGRPVYHSSSPSRSAARFQQNSETLNDSKSKRDFRRDAKPGVPAPRTCFAPLRSLPPASVHLCLSCGVATLPRLENLSRRRPLLRRPQGRQVPVRHRWLYETRASQETSWIPASGEVLARRPTHRLLDLLPDEVVGISAHFGPGPSSRDGRDANRAGGECPRPPFESNSAATKALALTASSPKPPTST